MLESAALQLLVSYIKANPEAAAIFAVIGFLQITVRPFCDWVCLAIAASPSTRDDQMLADLRENKIFKALAYVVKLLLGIKIPAVKPEVASEPAQPVG